jgi:endonuclease I
MAEYHRTEICYNSDLQMSYDMGSEKKQYQEERHEEAGDEIVSVYTVGTSQRGWQEGQKKVDARRSADQITGVLTGIKPPRRTVVGYEAKAVCVNATITRGDTTC